jgi:hypothetical protein
MEPWPLKLQTVSAPSRKGLEKRVLELYGPLAHIQSVTQKDSPGLGGFFASRSFEATVEVPEPGDASVSVLKPELDRLGIASLLVEDEAPAVDPGLYSGVRRRLMAPPVSVPGADGHLASAPMPEQAPAGGLSVYVGLLGDAAAAAGPGATLCGVLSPGARPAAGVAAFGLGDGSDAGSVLGELKLLDAREVFVAVDPSRKTEDTARWIAAVAQVAEVAAVVSVPGGAFTSTPNTVREYGYPVR